MRGRRRALVRRSVLIVNDVFFFACFAEQQTAKSEANEAENGRRRRRRFRRGRQEGLEEAALVPLESVETAAKRQHSRRNPVA